MTTRKIFHLTVGNDNYEPTVEEMHAIVRLFQEAEFDPRGSVVATSSMVQVASPIKVDVLELDGNTEFISHAALPDDLKAGIEWLHKSTGNLYEVITVSNLNSTKPDFVPTVVYRGRDGAVWSRPVSEFIEKFEPSFTDESEESE
jgi:hypothetical protein